MLICPDCKSKYKKTLFKRQRFCECGSKAKLVNIVAYEDVKVHVIYAPHVNPDLWAKSTLPATHPADDLVKIHTISADKRLKVSPRERCWLHDIFDDNGILYKVEMGGKYPMNAGGFKRKRKFKEMQYVYVEKSNAKKAKKLIRKYENAKVTDRSFEAVGCDEFDSDNRPQVPCPACGKQCDSDNAVCPACKAAMY
jgi:hypothetical protein